MSKYNLGSITRPTIDETSQAGTWTYGRVRLSIFSLHLSDSARLLLAWADAQEPSCIPTVAMLKEVFGWGKDRWRTVARELEAGGWLSQKKWPGAGGSTRHELKISLLQLAELSTEAQNPPIMCARVMSGNPPITREGRQACPSRDVGKTRPLYSRGIEEPIPTPSARARDGGVAAVGVSLEKVEGEGLKAAKPDGPTGLGSMLPDLLSQDEVVRVDKASAGASPTQLKAAETVVRKAVLEGVPKRLVSYALSMARCAARGAVRMPETPSAEAATAKQARRALLARRALKARWRVEDPELGELEAEADGHTWRGEKGIYAGSKAQEIWTAVDAGRLPLHPPILRQEAKHRAHPLVAAGIARPRVEQAPP